MRSQLPDVNSKEYEDFLNQIPVRPPAHLSDQIFNFVSKELNPSSWQVFAKLAFIHFSTGLVSLAFCPQFGVRTLGEGMGLMKAFSSLGSYGCMVACGAFFVGASLLVAGLLLKPEELRVLRKHSFLQLSAIAFLSLGSLIMADAEILLGFALAWIAGSLLGGFALLEATWIFRRRLIFAR